MKIDQTQVHAMTMDIIRSMTLDGYKPDYVVGVMRGGVLPALLISQYYNVPMYTQDNDCCNTWMAEDAFGCISEAEQATIKSRWDIDKRKKILIIGGSNSNVSESISWIKRDWQKSCFPNETSSWDAVWGNTVKTASLIYYDNAYLEEVDYYSVAVTLNPVEFYWEEWWK